MGRLNRLIEVQHFTVTRDSLGGVVEAWVTLAKVWASMSVLKPAERFIKTSNRRAITSLTQFTIHRRDDLDERMRVIDDHGVQWGIIGIKSDRRFLFLQVKRTP